MSKLVWDAIGTREFETGLSKGVLYPQAAGLYPKGYAWSGLTGVTESPSGAELTDLYADDIKYASLRAAETFGATIEAYMFPDEFAPCIGAIEVAGGVKISQQARVPFGVCYRTGVGSDTSADANDHYKIHIIYGATASPSETAYQTVNESPEAVTLSWELNTTPVPVTGKKPTAHLVIDSAKADPTKLAALEEILYGKDAVVEPAAPAVDPRLPLPDEIITLMTAA
jgi:hypothetical protein